MQLFQFGNALWQLMYVVQLSARKNPPPAPAAPRRKTKNLRKYISQATRNNDHLHHALLILLRKETSSSDVTVELIDLILPGLVALLCDMWEADKVHFLISGRSRWGVALKELVFAALSQRDDDMIKRINLSLANFNTADVYIDAALLANSYGLHGMAAYTTKKAIMYPTHLHWDVGTLRALQDVHQKLDPGNERCIRIIDDKLRECAKSELDLARSQEAMEVEEIAAAKKWAENRYQSKKMMAIKKENDNQNTKKTRESRKRRLDAERHN